MNQSRFRSKTAWVSIVTLILFVLKVYFKIEIPQADILVELIFTALIALGVFNNPEKGDSF